MQPNDRAPRDSSDSRRGDPFATLLRRGQLAGRLAVGKKELESKQRARYSHSHLSRRDVAETRKLPQSSKATGNEPGFMNTRVNVSRVETTIDTAFLASAYRYPLEMTRSSSISRDAISLS